MKTLPVQITALFLLITILFTPFSKAESGASEHASMASKHSALASAHATASTAKVASGVLAVPVFSAGKLSVVGGKVVSEAGEILVNVAEELNKPLVITEKVITVDPAPNQVL